MEYREPLLDYLKYKEDQREKLVGFFEKCVANLVNIKGVYPEISSRSKKPLEVTGTAA